MVECGKRMLPAEQAQLLPELLPLWNHPVALPEWPDKLPNEAIDPCKVLWLQAKQALHEANEALQACQNALQQQQALAHLIAELENHPLFPATPRHRRLMETLTYKMEKLQKAAGVGAWVLLSTQKQIAQNTVQAYEALLPKP
jgi:hypothetical protein